MIEYSRQVLENGLTVIIHRDTSSKLAAVNLLYGAGSKYDPEDKPGLAHLFEHIMFTGSLHAPDFDHPQQLAGGENNAYTNADHSNYYQILPSVNLDTALWLEADRMKNLVPNQQKLEIQKKVVMEEFYETCINTPFGDLWHHLAPMAYKYHPYRWPVIGKSQEQIAGIDLPSIMDFYSRHYHPSNAILTVCNPEPVDETMDRVERWFRFSAAEAPGKRNIRHESQQTALRKKEVKSPVPLDAICLAFHMPARSHPSYYSCDLLSDLLGNGDSARLPRELQLVRPVFSHIDTYITGTSDPGLFIIEGKLSEGYSTADGWDAIWTQLEELGSRIVSVDEVRKWTHKLETGLAFEQTSIVSKASHLAFCESIGDVSLVNSEMDYYSSVSPEDIRSCCQQLFRLENCSYLLYVQ